MKVTLKDISKRTGYSINTVSRALKDKEDISEKTKKYINDAAQEMGYIPNNIGSSLRSGLTKTIAVVLSDIANPYFSIMAKYIEIAAREYDYNIFLINSGETSELEKQAIYYAINKDVDGIILFPSQQDDNAVKYLKGIKLPFVIVGRHFRSLETDYLITDDVKGGYLATNHLIKSGRKQILFINGPIYISCAVEREEGYKRALADNGLELDLNLIKRVPIIDGYAYTAMKEILKEGVNYSGIFAFSDVIAWEVAYALEEEGIRIPDDIGLVGYDNIQSHMFFPFRLTSIDTSKEKIAFRAVEILMEKIGQEEKSDVLFQEKFDTKLIVRKSS